MIGSIQPLRTTMRLLLMPLWLALVLAFPANAESHAANDAVAEAMKRPRIAAALEARERMDRAAIARDVATISALQAPDVVLNGPNNRISDRAKIAANFTAGRIDHDSMTRSIEYAAERGSDVILMGEETVTPRNPTETGSIVRRRFTDIWTETPEGWKLALRQATIFERR